MSVNEIEDIVLPNDDALVANIFNDVKTRIEDETARRKTVRELKNEEPHFTEPEETAAPVASQVLDSINNDKQPQPELSAEAKQAEDEYLKFMMGEES